MRKILIMCMLLYATVAVEAQKMQSVICPSGQTVLFRQTKSGDAEVWHAWAGWPYYGDVKPTGRLVLPDSVVIDGQRCAVVAVGSNAFYRCDGLTSVELPKGCLTIGTQAFNGCTLLRSIALPEGLEEVGEGAFAYCRSLTEVHLPQSMKKIGISAFAICESLREIEMSDEARSSCNDLTFWGCTSLGKSVE